MQTEELDVFGRRHLPLLVAAILGTVTVTAALQGAADDRQTAKLARQHALEITTQAATGLSSTLEGRVTDVAGLFNASQAVSPEEFSAFTDPMLQDSKAASLSFIELVDGQDRTAFERRSGLTIAKPNVPGTPVPASARDRYAVVRYVKTADENQAEIGTDVLSSGVDAEAIAAAERTRSPQSTRPFLIDGNPDPGVRLYVPVYGADAGPSATRQPIGLVSATFRFRDLSLISPQMTGAETEVRIAGAPEFVLGKAHGDVARAKAVIAGRTWEFRVASPPTAKALFGLTKSQAIAIILTILTLLITAVTRQAVVAAERSDELADLRQTERDQAVRDRKADQAAVNALLTHLPDLAVMRFDADMKILSASGGLIPHAGWSREELEGSFVPDVFGNSETVLGGVRGALDGQASGFSFSGIRVADKRYWMQALPLPGDERAGLLVASDVTALMGAETARAEAQSRFARVFDSAPVGMALVNTKGKFVQVNEAMSRITGYDTGALLQMGPPNVTHPADIAVTQRQVKDLLTGRLPGFSVEKRYLHADGHVVWVSLNTTVLTDSDGQPEFILAHVVDITERHAFAEQLQHLANHDPLTDLRNRRSFEECLETQLACVRRYREPAALLMIDLDHFKSVNDTHGHAAGDWVLTGVADTLRRVLRDSDTIGRLGGDEFAVLLPKATPTEAVIVADKVTAALRDLGQQFSDANGPPPVTASIGVAVLRGQHASSDEVFADADAALYSVKSAGRDNFAVAELEPGAQPAS